MAITNQDISRWIEGDEGLYTWWKTSGVTKELFIKKNRKELVKCISNVLESKKPEHYLAYGPDKRF